MHDFACRKSLGQIEREEQKKKLLRFAICFAIFLIAVAVTSKPLKNNKPMTDEIVVKKASAQEASPTPTPLKLGKGWAGFKESAKRISAIYGIDSRLIIAQGALESAHGTSQYAVERNNFLGIGAVDWNPDQAFYFDNTEDCVLARVKLVRDNFPEAWEMRHDATVALNLLKHNNRGMMYATDPLYIDKVMSMREWKGGEIK